jgi:hypothetical protein
MKKNDYAFIVSCNPAYGFGLISTMNAQNYFGTAADWEIAYEGYEQDHRDRISAAFPFAVNWTPVSDLMQEVNDRRTDRSSPLDRMWLAYWLLAHKVLREKKYKAVCVIQADEFLFVNVDTYFNMAGAGFVISSEYPFNFLRADELPFGDDKNVWDRSISAIFDGVNFIGQEHTQLPRDIVNFQEEDSFRGEANHSVIALNRAVCKHVRKDKILSLNGRLWVCDSIWPSTKLYRIGEKIYNNLEIQLNAWHCRWWQPGRAEAEWRSCRPIVLGPNAKEEIIHWDNCEHNYNFTRDFMKHFNDMIPEIRSDQYVKDFMRRPRYELGEE